MKYKYLANNAAKRNPSKSRKPRATIGHQHNRASHGNSASEGEGRMGDQNAGFEEYEGDGTE